MQDGAPAVYVAPFVPAAVSPTLNRLDTPGASWPLSEYVRVAVTANPPSTVPGVTVPRPNTDSGAATRISLASLSSSPDTLYERPFTRPAVTLLNGNVPIGE